ncbi:MAG: hypothetical protein Q8K70_04970 [Bacteroidota bacterium]|nr:hypothetical protein [Bacteroidota bacterium]
MKKLFLIISILTLGLNKIYSQQHIVDIHYGIKLYYSHKNFKMEENACISYNNLYIDIPKFDSIPDTSIKSKLNKYVENMMIGQLNNIGFRQKLTSHAINSEKAYLINQAQELATCDFNLSLYSPNITNVSYSFGVLNHDILPFVVTYTYSTSVKNNKRMVGLRYVSIVYINIKKGIIYTSNDIFKPNTTTSINALIGKKFLNKDYFLSNTEFKTSKNSYNDNDYYEEDDYYTSEEDYPIEDAYEYDEMVPSEYGTTDNYNDTDYDESEEEDDRVYEEVEAVSDESNSRYRQRESYDYSYKSKGSQSKEKQTIKPETGNYFNNSSKSNDKSSTLKDFSFDKNGIFVLNNVSMTCIIAGFQPCHNLPFGKAIKINFSQEEIKQFINPNGPYGFLLQMNQESNVNQFEQINNLDIDKQNYSFSENEKILLNTIDPSVKRIEISTLNTNYLYKYKIKGKEYIDSMKYKVSEYRYYQNSLLTKVKSRTNYNYYDTTFQTTDYLYNTDGNMTLKTSYNPYKNISKDTFIYDSKKNLILIKSYQNASLNSIVRLHYFKNIVLKEIHISLSDETEYVSYNFNLKNQIDTIINYSNQWTKVLRYDSMGNNILVYNFLYPEKHFQYSIYNTNNQLEFVGYILNPIAQYTYNEKQQVTSISNDYAGNVLIAEYDANNRLKSILRQSKNSENNKPNPDMLYHYFD